MDHKKFKRDFSSHYQARLHMGLQDDVVAGALMDALADADTDHVAMAALGACVSQASNQDALLLDLEACDPGHPVLRFIQDRRAFLEWVLGVGAGKSRR